MVGTCQDITDQKAVQEEIEHSRQFLSAITDNMAEGMIATDREGKVTFVNAAAERLLGWEAAELLGKSAHATYHSSGLTGPRTRGRIAPCARFGSATRHFTSTTTCSSAATGRCFLSHTALPRCRGARSAVR